MKNKCYIFSLLFLAMLLGFQSCNDDETYADKRKRENKQISSFISNGCFVISDDSSDEALLQVKGGIRVISESQFYAQDSTTNVDNNEYVYFDKTGVYMQIISKGVSTKGKIKDGESLRVLVRYTEFNIASDSIQTSNCTLSSETSPDVMQVSNTSSTFTGTFLSGVMYTTYSSSAVPAAWLVPLTYINLPRLDSENAELAHVRLIVPSSQGQANASQNVYPCFYDITYQRGK